MRRTYQLGEAQSVADRLGIDFSESPFDLEQFRAGLNVEAEHGAADPATNVTDDDPVTTGKIALAHLHELPDYYTRLGKMEAEGESGKADSERDGVPTMKSRLPAFALGVVIVLLSVATACAVRAARGGAQEPRGQQ